MKKTVSNSADYRAWNWRGTRNCHNVQRETRGTNHRCIHTHTGLHAKTRKYGCLCAGSLSLSLCLAHKFPLHWHDRKWPIECIWVYYPRRGPQRYVKWSGERPLQRTWAHIPQREGKANVTDHRLSLRHKQASATSHLPQVSYQHNISLLIISVSKMWWVSVMRHS